MRCFIRLLLLLCASALPSVALADSLTIYDLQGGLKSGGSASGTISINSQTGGLIEINVTVTQGGTLYLFEGGPYRSGGSTMSFTEQFIEGPSGSNFNYLTLSFPRSSLLGYAGGPLCSLSLACGNGAVSSLELTGGLYPEDPNFHPAFDSFITLTATVPSVPEPGTLALVGTGLASLLSAIRRRRGR